MSARYYAEINQADKFGNNAMSSALTAGHYDLALYIKKKGGILSLPAETITLLLCNMASNNESQKIEAWLHCGANPNLGDYDNRTPLHIAYSKNNLKVIELLLRHNGVKDVADRWGKKPVECVGITVFANETVINMSPMTKRKCYSKVAQIKSPSLNVPSDLLAAVIDQINDLDDKAMRQALLPSLLCEAIFVRDHDLLNDLCMDPRTCDYDLRTPLHIAASIGDLEAVKVLVRSSADVNALDRFGNTPLFEACMKKHDVVCEHLLKNKAGLKLPKETQVSLLCWAVYNKDCDMITRLFENGIDLNCVDYDGRSCFDVAVDCGNTNVIALLNTLTGRAEGYKVEKDWQDRQERKRERKEKKLSERGKDR